MGEHSFFLFSIYFFLIWILFYVVFCCLCLSFSLVHCYCERDDALSTMVMMANWNSQQQQPVSCVCMCGSCHMCQALGLLFLQTSLIISEIERKEAEKEKSMCMCVCANEWNIDVFSLSTSLCIYFKEKIRDNCKKRVSVSYTK